jgi:hypothetical protein
VPPSTHSTFNSAFEKIQALKMRKPGQPHLFVMGAATEQRYLTVASECAKAMKVDAR